MTGIDVDGTPLNDDPPPEPTWWERWKKWFLDLFRK